MTTAEAKEVIGLFAYIEANGDDYYKGVHGRITEVDRTSVWFEDNEGQPYHFKLKNIHHFELMKFEIANQIPD